MNIRSFLGLFTSSLTTEIQDNIGELERSLIQHELESFTLEAKILAIKGKIEYLKLHPQAVHPESRS